METEMSPQKSSMSKTSMVLIGVISIALIVTIFTIVKGLKSDGNSGGSPSPDPGGDCSQTGESCDDPSDCCNENATCDDGTCAGGSTPTPPSGGSCSKTHPENKGECSTDSPACPENQFCCTPSPGGCPTECANYCFCSNPPNPTTGLCDCPFEMDGNGCCSVPLKDSQGKILPWANCCDSNSQSSTTPNPGCNYGGGRFSSGSGVCTASTSLGTPKNLDPANQCIMGPNWKMESQRPCVRTVITPTYCQEVYNDSSENPAMWWTGQFNSEDRFSCIYSPYKSQGLGNSCVLGSG